MITTIIPTFRRPELLKQAVKSVLKQTYPHFQVCVYDNASGDKTEEIMQGFVKKDSRVKYYRHVENIGMMANYKYALSRVNTPFFSLLSDDDFLLPCFYETALKSFEEFPDAAFSACGVVAVNENDEFVSDSLHLWKREGYYAAPEGALEMINEFGNFFIPTSTLFQHKYVKNIIPDWSPEIQPRWDTDYLLRIAVRYPIIINKKTCGVYLAHANSFSTAFFNEAQKSNKGFEDYFKATDKILQRLLDCPYLTSDLKEKVKKTFIILVRKEVFYTHISPFIKHKKIRQAIRTAKFLKRDYGFDRCLAIYITRVTVLTYMPILRPLVLAILAPIRAIKRFIKGKKQKVVIKTDMDFNQIKKYKEWIDEEI